MLSERNQIHSFHRPREGGSLYRPDFIRMQQTVELLASQKRGESHAPEIDWVKFTESVGIFHDDSAGMDRKANLVHFDPITQTYSEVSPAVPLSNMASMYSKLPHADWEVVPAAYHLGRYHPLMARHVRLIKTVATTGTYPDYEEQVNVYGFKWVDMSFSPSEGQQTFTESFLDPNASATGANQPDGYVMNLPSQDCHFHIPEGELIWAVENDGHWFTDYRSAVRLYFGVVTSTDSGANTLTMDTLIGMDGKALHSTLTATNHFDWPLGGKVGKVGAAVFDGTSRDWKYIQLAC